jgi:hypothetical protein
MKKILTFTFVAWSMFLTGAAGSRIAFPRSILSCEKGLEIAGSRARARFFLRLVEKGERPSDKVIGLHGTSQEAVLNALATGNFPAGPVAPGYLFMSPLPEVLLSVKSDRTMRSYLSDGEYDFETQKDRSIEYARLYAQTHRFLAILGLAYTNFNDLIDVEAILSSSDGEIRKERLTADQALLNAAEVFRTRGFTVEQLVAAKNEASGRRGFLLSFSRDRVVDNYPLSCGEIGDEDIKLYVGCSGFSLRAVEGIQVLGSREQ